MGADFFIHGGYEPPKGDNVSLNANTSKHHGNKRISGKIEVEGQSAENWIIDLYDEISQEHVKTVKTNSTGNFVFENIAGNHTYFIIAKDPTGHWEHPISSRRTPV